jgi:hypothetical protein
MIGSPHQKLDCETGPVLRIARITLEIGNHQSRVSFINLAHQLLRLLSEQLVDSAGRWRWLPARISFQALYAFQQRTLHISSLGLTRPGGRPNVAPAGLRELIATLKLRGLHRRMYTWLCSPHSLLLLSCVFQLLDSQFDILQYECPFGKL